MIDPNASGKVGDWRSRDGLGGNHEARDGGRVPGGRADDGDGPLRLGMLSDGRCPKADRPGFRDGVQAGPRLEESPAVSRRRRCTPSHVDRRGEGRRRSPDRERTSGIDTIPALVLVAPCRASGGSMQRASEMVKDGPCDRRTIERVPSDFENTRWSIIARAASADESTRREALDAFARIYRPACVGFLRQRGFQAEFADEVTQGFFTEVVLARNLLHGAAPDKGRLRSLIRRALENYARDTLRRGMARGRHEAHAARDADDAAPGGKRGERDPVSGFDSEWARAQLTEAI